MAAENPERPATAAGEDDELTVPQYPAGPPSIISSRMTDIASEDGDGSPVEASQRRGSAFANESRPGTARTGMSSRGAWPQSSSMRKNYQKRGSLAGSTAGSVATARPQTSTSTTHVPSLTSHAFFHPMSSQKLQAQRGSSRPQTTMSQNRTSIEYTSAEEPSEGVQQRITTSSPISHLADDDDNIRPPPSRGTEMTEPYDRGTTTTSPTQGHNPASSLTESVRPLQRRKNEEVRLSVNVDKSKNYSPSGNPSPMKSPRSFRSNFFAGGDSAPSPRAMPGAEKLSSGAPSPQFTARDAPSRGSNSRSSPKKSHARGRNWEYFEGNTVFCLGGRLQNTRHRPINIATGGLVVLPSALFLAFSAPYLWFHASPAVPIVFGYLFYICISSFLHASGSDPGILPRNLHQFPPPPENEDPLRLAPPMNDWTLIKSAEPTTAAMEVPVKYCKTCNIWRPPRAHHCRLCDNCIETQDHHCVWLNNCVGRRNYRYFFTFVTSGTLLALFLIGASLAHLLIYCKEENVSFGESINRFRVPFAMVIYGALIFVYPAALMVYHLFLVARGETTREFLNSHKFLKKNRYRAFTQASVVRNWIVVLCRPRPPTYYRFKHSFEEGDQRLGEKRSKVAPVKKPEASNGVPGSQPSSRHNGQDMEMHTVRPAGTPGFEGPTALRRNEGTTSTVGAAPR